MFRRILTILNACVAVSLSPYGLTPARAQDAEPLFHARFADGTVVAGEPVRDWHDVNATPRIATLPLFDPKRPAEWLVRESPLPNASPAAYIEFVGGDRMPGEVIGYSTGSESPYRRLPSHFIVRPTSAMRRPNTEFDPVVRIESQYVQRVVWQPDQSQDPSPMTAVRRDGSRTSFRALRWTENAISLLTDNGVAMIPFAELASVSLNSGDPWQAYFDHAATVLPDAEGRLVQIETSDGLIALTSTQRLRAETHGDNRRSDHWHQVIQPAWCLDPLWIPFPTIVAWRSFPPERVPFTLLDPQVSRKEVVFSAALHPVLNRATTGAPLTDGITLFGWGIGTHAPCELVVELPPQAIAFTTGFGLDPSVGTGGCAIARVELRSENKSQKLFESDLLIGASPPKSTSRLPLKADSNASKRQLALVSDPVYNNRPSGADPFDIRDSLSWIGPQVELDPTFAKEELRRRAPSQMLGLAGWNVESDTSSFATVTSRWDTRDWEDPRYRSFVSVENGYLLLSRSLRIDKEHRYLAVYAHSPHDEFRPARIQVRLDGTVLGEMPVPIEHSRREPDPLLFPIDNFVGQTVLAEIIQLPGAINESKPAAVDWRGAELVSHRPGLRTLFEEDPEFANLLAEGEGSVALTTNDRNSGEASLQIAPTGRGSSNIPGWDHLVTEEPLLGEYRVLRFSWKAGASGPIAFSLGHNQEFGTNEGVFVPPPRVRRAPSRSDDRGPRNGYRYVAGDVGEHNDLTPAIRLDGKAPEAWRVVQRDLYSDFGSFRLTGLNLTTYQGPLNVDGIYLARNADQFRFIEEAIAGPPQPEQGQAPVTLKTGNPAAFPKIVSRVAPSFGLSGQGGELQLLSQYRDRNDVLRTHPEGGEERQSGRLSAALKLPEKGTPRLRLSVSQHGSNDNDQKDWDLQILANGRELLARRIDRDAAKGGWLDINIDLAELKGQNVLLELRHKASGWDSEYAYWQNVRIETN